MMTAARLKILHTSETALGGIGIYLNCLAKMDPKHFDQIFVVPSEHAMTLLTHHRVVRFLRKKRGLVSLIHQIAIVHKAISNEKPDIVVFHSTFSLLALLIVRFVRAGMSNPRLIYIAHCWSCEQYTGFKARLCRVIEGQLCGLADLIINVSQNDQKIATDNKFRGRHILVENAVTDVSSDLYYDFLKFDPKIINLLFVGRFDHQKGLDILIDALAAAVEINPQLRLHVVGGTVREGRSPVFPAGIAVKKWVANDEMDQWYRSADAIVVPSRWEGLPLVIPEALRNGTPLIVSQRSGMQYLFDEGIQGFSFQLTVEALTELLVSLDRDQLHAMRPACRALYELRYSMPRLHSDILNAYDSVLSTKRTHDPTKQG